MNEERTIIFPSSSDFVGRLIMRMGKRLLEVGRPLYIGSLNVRDVCFLPLSPPFATSIPSPNESGPRNEEAINFLPGRIIKLRYKMLPINIAGTRPLNWAGRGRRSVTCIMQSSRPFPPGKSSRNSLYFSPFPLLCLRARCPAGPCSTSIFRRVDTIRMPNEHSTRFR